MSQRPRLSDDQPLDAPNASRRMASNLISGGGQRFAHHFAAVGRDEHIVFDPDSTEIQHFIDHIPIDHLRVTLASDRVIQQCRDEVDARLDRDHISGRKRQIGSQIGQAESDSSGTRPSR